MRTIAEIIADAQEALKRQYADIAEKDAQEKREERERNAKLWAPIVEGLKPFIPVELHHYISFNADEPPTWGHWDSYSSEMRSISITLPVLEGYTVFGYLFQEYHGFKPGVLLYEYETDKPYWAPSGARSHKKSEIAQMSSFDIALAETIANPLNKPRVKGPKPEAVASYLPSLDERLTDTLRAIIRSEVEAIREEEGAV